MADEVRSILIVDGNEAFATLLKEGLEQIGEFRASIACTGTQALETLRTTGFDMVILDLGLSEPDGVDFARTLRAQHPDLRMMLIPLMGEEVPSELADLDFQGVLTKPFFFPELPEIVGEALKRTVGSGGTSAAEPTNSEQPPVAPSPVASEAAAPEAAGETSVSPMRAGVEKHLRQVNQIMANLAQEIGAEAVILTCGAELLACAGRVSSSDAHALAALVHENRCTSARMAQILGCTPSRFEQSIDWGELIVYSLALVEDILLATALSASVPLGMVRHSTKSTADKLRRVIETGL
ncbi:MAG: response regulator [Anaerolineae bacterium]|nr:response regulator [Anaerolineae bacterium]